LQVGIVERRGRASRARVGLEWCRPRRQTCMREGEWARSRGRRATRAVRWRAAQARSSAVKPAQAEMRTSVCTGRKAGRWDTRRRRSTLERRWLGVHADMAMARESARPQSGAAGGWEWPDAWAQAATAREEDPSGHGEPSIYMRTQCGGSADVAAAGCREAREPSGSGADECQHNARVCRAKAMHAVRGRQPEMRGHMVHRAGT
jgi:hypothetical protein